MLPQAALLLAEEHFAASGRQVLPISGATYLEPGDFLGVVYALLMRVPIAVIQSTNSAPAVSPPTNAPEVAAISEPSLAAAAATASPLPALLERLTPEQRVSFLRVWHRQPRHLPEITFDLHGRAWTPAGIEELGDVLREFSGCFFQLQNGFLAPALCALIASRRHILVNSARTLLLMPTGASTPSLVSSETTAPRTAAGKNACCATAAATKQGDPEPALARAAATGQAGNTTRVSHTTPNLATICKTFVPDIHSRSLTAAKVKTPIASHNCAPISPALQPDPISYALFGSRGIP